MLAGLRGHHPGALTDSDLLSWNWSSHGDSSLTDSASLAAEYCEIIKQLSEGDYDSGQDSDVQPHRAAPAPDTVEVCEEETQVGLSLLDIPGGDDSKMDTRTPTESDRSSDSEPEYKFKTSDGDEELLAQALRIDKTDIKIDDKPEEAVEMPAESSNVDSPDGAENVETKEELAEEEEAHCEKDRMLSDCTDRTPKVDLKSSYKDRKNSEGGKREKISPPVGSAVISGPLEVCLALGLEWKRRYLTLVEDSLYVWTSHR